jgi:signal transduction histidine kinase
MGTRKKNHNSYGIGLSIAKAVVEAHGGKIEVSSSVGFGTRFSILLPS